MKKTSDTVRTLRRWGLDKAIPYRKAIPFRLRTENVWSCLWALHPEVWPAITLYYAALPACAPAPIENFRLGCGYTRSFGTPLIIRSLFEGWAAVGHGRGALEQSWTEGGR